MAAALTELDHTILAIVWDRGPCSAYVVRKEFEHSASTTWSSSAGSVYPAIKRLTEKELLRSDASADRRGTQLLTVTPKAKRALRRWISHLSPDIGRSTADPIRTRAQFLTLLPAKERKAFVELAIARTRQGLDIAEEQIGEAVRFNRGQREALIVGLAGVRLELFARLAWLEWLSEVGDSIPELPEATDLQKRLLKSAQQC